MNTIKVNLPRNEQGFNGGYGEGCFVEVAKEVSDKYDSNDRGGQFEGVLANDSYYYPELKTGDKIQFTMRGDKRPVALIENFLENYYAINDEEFNELIEKLAYK